jgi:ethanolamine utilization protein EutN
MLQAVVVGNVWSTKRIDGLPSGALLEVEVTGSGDRLVAFDVLGSGQGERVLVAQGSVASGWLPGRPPVDALIIGSIDEPADSPVPAPTAAATKGSARKARPKGSGS